VPSDKRTVGRPDNLAVAHGDEQAVASFREYLLSRRRSFTPAGEHLTEAIKNSAFLAIQSARDLEEFLTKHNLSPDAAVHARIVWRNYLTTKKKLLR
jgi:hypothetical protein